MTKKKIVLNLSLGVTYFVQFEENTNYHNYLYVL